MVSIQGSLISIRFPAKRGIVAYTGNQDGKFGLPFLFYRIMIMEYEVQQID